jgi:hypothetical protein
MKAKEFTTGIKPRNFVAKNAKTGGAGAHTDKKKAQKQGYEKHKKQGVAESVNPEVASVLGRIADTEDYDQLYDLMGDTGPVGEYLQDQIQDITMETGLHPDDDFERIESIIMDRIQQDFGGQNDDEGGETDDAYALASAGHGSDEDYESIEMERVRDPEDWDEGNTEPPNNFAIYINGKKWKVFAGRGTYADDHRERTQYRQLQDLCAKKTAATGKKWQVSPTGEAPTA